jgi:hypothetical protein
MNLHSKLSRRAGRIAACALATFGLTGYASASDPSTEAYQRSEATSVHTAIAQQQQYRAPGYKWGKAGQSVERIDATWVAGETAQVGYKWAAQARNTENTIQVGSAQGASAEDGGTTAVQAGYRWGIRNVADQAGYRWGIRNVADQAGYRWGIRNVADQAGYRWGIRNVADQAGYRWGIRNVADQAGYRWGIRSVADQAGYRWGIRNVADQAGYRWGIRSVADQAGYRWGIRNLADQAGYRWGIR